MLLVSACCSHKFSKIVVVLCSCAQILPPASSCHKSPLDNCSRGHVQLVDIDPCVWLLLQLLLSLGTGTLKPGGTSSCCCSSCEREREREGDRQQLRGRPQKLLEYSRHGKVVHLSDRALKIWHRFLVRELADCHRHSAVWKLWNGILKKANCSAPSTTSRGHVSLVKKISRCSGARLLSVWEGAADAPASTRGA